MNDLNNIKEEGEEEVEVEENKIIPFVNNESSSSSVSDTFYSLDGSNCDEDSENVQCDNEENEDDTFSSACSSLPPLINLMEEIKSQPSKDQSEIETLIEKDYLTLSWTNNVAFDKNQNPHLDKYKDGNIKHESHQDQRSQTFYASKWVALEDMSAKLNISKETSLEDCCPEEIDEILTGCISTADILIAVYSDEKELGKVLHNSGGVIGYVRKYWAGFFPLLLINLTKVSSCDPVSELDSCLLANQFSFSHRVIIEDISSDTKFLLQSIVRYHLHVHQLQCSRLALVKRGSLIKSLSNAEWKCPGLCKLQTINPEREQVRAKKKKSFFQSVRRSLTVRRATRRSRSKSIHSSTFRNSSNIVNSNLV